MAVRKLNQHGERTKLLEHSNNYRRYSREILSVASEKPVP